MLPGEQSWHYWLCYSLQKMCAHSPQGDDIHIGMWPKASVAMCIIQLYDLHLCRCFVNLQEKQFPRCFLSYCWTNSHNAIKLGSKAQPGSLGPEDSDPRRIKQELESAGISCWIDLEHAGQVCPSVIKDTHPNMLPNKRLSPNCCGKCLLKRFFKYEY